MSIATNSSGSVVGKVVGCKTDNERVTVVGELIKELVSVSREEAGPNAERFTFRNDFFVEGLFEG